MRRERRAVAGGAVEDHVRRGRERRPRCETRDSRAERAWRRACAPPRTRRSRGRRRSRRRCRACALTSAGSTSSIWLLICRISSAPDGLIVETPEAQSGIADFRKYSASGSRRTRSGTRQRNGAPLREGRPEIVKARFHPVSPAALRDGCGVASGISGHQEYRTCARIGRYGVQTPIVPMLPPHALPSCSPGPRDQRAARQRHGARRRDRGALRLDDVPERRVVRSCSSPPCWARCSRTRCCCAAASCRSSA